MKKMFKEFAKSKGIVHMGIGMLIGASFLHLVSAIVKQFVMFPLKMLLGMNNCMQPEMLAKKKMMFPYLMIFKGGVIHTLIVFIIVCICCYYFLKWSEKINNINY
jgi:large-conductance mechanosensitive channel